MTTEDAVAQSTAPEAEERDGISLKRWERGLALLLALGLTAALFALFLASPRFASTMLEYVLKFVPLFVDGSIWSILDFNGAGDPRGRVVNSFFTWINIQARQKLWLQMAIHPAMGINWLLYPLTLAVFYKAVCRMGYGLRYAAMASLLYAASPGMVDTLCDYYLPGKALVNLWFALSLYGLSMFISAADKQRPVLGAVVLGTTTFLGLLSDETAIFIPVCAVLLLGGSLIFRSDVRRHGSLLLASFATAFAAFAVVALVAVPLANAVLQQAPLDLLTTIRSGPQAALFGEHARPIGNLIQYYAPFGLLETVMSAHLVPGRTVNVSWTYHEPLPWFFQWPLREQLALYLFFAATFVLARKLPVEWKAWSRRVGLVFLIYILLQSLLVVALAGYLTESSYYAALSSALLALLIGAIAAAPGRNHGMRVFSWALVTYMMAVQLANMVDTARRHPYLGDPSLTWHELEQIRSGILRGDSNEILAAQPFPSRRFFYAFEIASAFESTKGRHIDFRPMDEPQKGLVRHLDIHQWGDPSIGPLGDSSPRAEAELSPSYEFVAPVDSGFFRAGTVRGQNGSWRYRWRFDGTGAVVQESWRHGLMRLWFATGQVERRGDEICVVFPTARATCFAYLYKRDEWILALGVDGRIVTRFRWER